MIYIRRIIGLIYFVIALMIASVIFWPILIIKGLDKANCTMDYLIIEIYLNIINENID